VTNTGCRGRVHFRATAAIKTPFAFFECGNERHAGSGGANSSNSKVTTSKNRHMRTAASPKATSAARGWARTVPALNSTVLG
jgi:hypothetical protein